jgi:DNA repair exonuclease SbcCD nuclease subunit
MKILITVDLHYREHWFQWLLAQGGDYDLICIAGDLLDMFSREPRMVQAMQVGRWIRELAKITLVAICSGNHDDAGRQISADRRQYMSGLWHWERSETLSLSSHRDSKRFL